MAVSLCQIGRETRETHFSLNPSNTWPVIPTPFPSLPSATQAGGSEGIQVTAKLTEAQLAPSALALIRRLLALEPSSTLASISTSADEHRNATTHAGTTSISSPGLFRSGHSKELNCPGGIVSEISSLSFVSFGDFFQKVPEIPQRHAALLGLDSSLAG